MHSGVTDMHRSKSRRLTPSRSQMDRVVKLEAGGETRSGESTIGSAGLKREARISDAKRYFETDQNS